MKEAQIAQALAARLWASREALAFTLRPARHTRARAESAVGIELGGGLRIDVDPSRWRVVVDSDGHRQTLEYYLATVVIRTWRAVQIAGILADLGETLDAPAIMSRPRTRLERALAAIGLSPARWPGQGLAEHLDELLAAFVNEGRTTRREETEEYRTLDDSIGTRSVIWHEAAPGIAFARTTRYGLNGSTEHIVVAHPRWGGVEIGCRHVETALRRARDGAYRLALAGPPGAAPAPAVGNARIARISRLCRDALAIDPDLADANGTPMRPLIDEHIPRLLRAHSDAARTAPAQDLARIDDDLERGIEIVRDAVEQALDCLADRKRQELATELRFLAARHPERIQPRLDGPIRE